MGIAIPTHPKRNPDTSFRQIGDAGGLVVMSGHAQVKVLNPTAIKVFSLLDGSHTPAEIASEIAAEFEVTSEQAIEDVEMFLRELADHGMLAADAGA